MSILKEEFNREGFQTGLPPYGCPKERRKGKKERRKKKKKDPVEANVPIFSF
jgi:hypothetical protein